MIMSFAVTAETASPSDTHSCMLDEGARGSSSLLQKGVGRIESEPTQEHSASGTPVQRRVSDSSHGPTALSENMDRAAMASARTSSFKKWRAMSKRDKVQAVPRTQKLHQKSEPGQNRSSVIEEKVIAVAPARKRRHKGGSTQKSRVREPSTMPWTAGAREFKASAESLKPTTDKVSSHSYQTMYGMFLAPLSTAQYQPRLFEIGLGCDMDYGPGAGARMWRNFLPRAVVWIADIDAACVEQIRAKTELKNVNYIIGDQSNKQTLQKWIEVSGGNFDVIVDDGGHSNFQIKTSFDALWPEVKPGGLYFLEDLHVGEKYDDTNGTMVMSDVLQAWTEQLLIPTDLKTGVQRPRDATNIEKWPLPDGVAFVLCQRQACVVGKSDPTDNSWLA